MLRGKFRKTSILLAVILSLSLVFAACGGNDSANNENAPIDNGSAASDEAPASTNDGEVYTVRIGTATLLPSHQNWFMEEFKTALEAKSDQFVVELYPSNQLGTNAEMIQGLQNGNIQAIVLPAGMFVTIAPSFQVLNVPGLIPGADTHYKMLNDPEVGAAFKAEVAKSGVTPLGFLWCPSMEFYLNKEVTDMSGLKGLKIRGSDAKPLQDMVTSFGATPVVMSSGDVMMALQQGTVDGLCTAVDFASSMGAYEFAPYCLKDLPGVSTTSVVMVSNTFIDSLPADLLEIFEETVSEVRERAVDYTIQYEKDCYTRVEEGGGTILQPSDSFVAEVDAKNKETQETFKNDYPELIEFYDMVEKWISENT